MDSYDQYKQLGRPIDFLMECWTRSLSTDPAEKAEFNWAFMELVDDASDNPERAWQCILHALDDFRFAEHFGVLAAGPVEDLLSYHGDAFIERVEALARENPKFAQLLGGVWQFQMSEEVWRRVQQVWDRRGWDGILKMPDERNGRGECVDGVKLVAWRAGQSFVSRNNDIAGYWGIGVLYLYALQTGALNVTIDIVGGSVNPPVTQLLSIYQRPNFEALIDRYRTMLLACMNQRRVPEVWVNEAKFSIEFESKDAEPAYLKIGEKSEAFACRLLIKDDLGRERVLRIDGWCWSHDPLREMKSGRAC